MKIKSGDISREQTRKVELHFLGQGKRLFLPCICTAVSGVCRICA